jgi:hypothetical protein
MAFAIAIRFNRGTLARIVFVGSAWGLTLAAGLFAINAPQCELPCPADFAVTTAICIGTGILTIGPLAAFAARR